MFKFFKKNKKVAVGEDELNFSSANSEEKDIDEEIDEIVNNMSPEEKEIYDAVGDAIKDRMKESAKNKKILEDEDETSTTETEEMSDREYNKMRNNIIKENKRIEKRNAFIEKVLARSTEREAERNISYEQLNKKIDSFCERIMIAAEKYEKPVVHNDSDETSSSEESAETPVNENDVAEDEADTETVETMEESTPVEEAVPSEATGTDSEVVGTDTETSGNLSETIPSDAEASDTPVTTVVKNEFKEVAEEPAKDTTEEVKAAEPDEAPLYHADSRKSFVSNFSNVREFTSLIANLKTDNFHDIAEVLVENGCTLNEEGERVRVNFNGVNSIVVLEKTADGSDIVNGVSVNFKFAYMPHGNVIKKLTDDLGIEYIDTNGKGNDKTFLISQFGDKYNVLRVTLDGLNCGFMYCIIDSKDL